jgi:hypothetical protein
VLSNAAHATEQKHTPASEQAQLVNVQVGMARQKVGYHLARARVAATVRHPGTSTPLQPATDGLVRVMGRIYAARQRAPAAAQHRLKAIKPVGKRRAIGTLKR